MSIQELSLKFKGILHNTEYQLAGLIVIVSFISFFLGRTSLGLNVAKYDINTENVASSIISTKSSEKTPSETMEIQTNSSVLLEKTGKYVASKNGTKYHLPWCGSAKRIKEENEIWFDTKTGAERAGYSPAKNCKGI